jgi:uncharacterized glyoxalase superfamily protein PhnB
MAKLSRLEQLDLALDALLLRPSDAQPPADAELAPLVVVAAQLRDLPREDFRIRLKADLERSAIMSSRTVAVKPVQQGLQTLTPYIVSREAEEVIAFVKQAFEAEEIMRATGSQGGLHAEVRIGDSTVMIGGGGPPWKGTPMPTHLHVYVPDADAVYHRALEAGATSIYAPMDQPYGDREGGVRDVAGNNWYIGTHKLTGHYIPEGLGTVTPGLLPRGAARLIDFLKQAFGAEESFCEKTPDGAVVHAKVQIGNSVLEMGEAHGPFGPLPTTFLLRVDDVDAAYRQALAAGATSIGEPANQPYGERMGAVKDAWDNHWYLAAPIRP